MNAYFPTGNAVHVDDRHRCTPTAKPKSTEPHQAGNIGTSNLLCVRHNSVPDGIKAVHCARPHGRVKFSNSASGHNSELDTEKIVKTRNEHNKWDPERLVGQNEANTDNERTSQKKTNDPADCATKKKRSSISCFPVHIRTRNGNMFWEKKWTDTVPEARGCVHVSTAPIGAH